MATAFLSLGANLGDRARTIATACKKLPLKNMRLSSFYETEPWGNRDQPWFLNAAVHGETDLSPKDLLKETQKIESELGRDESSKGFKKWGPRTLDIDILFYGDHIIKTPSLVIPHPFLHERRFILVPLAEIAPDFVHPALKKTIAELLKECADNSTVKRSL